MTQIGSADIAAHAAIAAYVAGSQRDPSRHVTYVGEAAESILEEFAAIDRWSERLRIATTDGELAGVLLADIDSDRRRVWWVGPWAETSDIATELLDEARTEFGELFDEEEMVPDSRNSMVRSIAARRGFTEETWSSVLTRTRPTPPGPSISVPLTTVRAAAVARLHDRLFQGTHTTGERLVTSEHTQIRCVIADDVVAGYIAFEIQPDGSGYIDFLGVEPAFRRRSLGRSLVMDACRELAGSGVDAVHLTVRADAPGAIELYRSSGFAEERRIVPFRRGFTLG